MKKGEKKIGNQRVMKIDDLTKAERKQLRNRSRTKKLKDLLLGTKLKDGGVVIGKGEDRKVMRVKDIDKENR